MTSEFKLRFIKKKYKNLRDRKKSYPISKEFGELTN